MKKSNPRRGSAWYDRKGKVIAQSTWKGSTMVNEETWIKDMEKVEKLLSDKDYKVVKQDFTPQKQYWVSTVWLGLDHDFMGDKPLIFETMVFTVDKKGKINFSGEESVRSSTEKEALTDHSKFLRLYTELEKLEPKEKDPKDK